MPLPWKDVHDYLQLPSHTYPFYWQNAEMAEMADAVQNVGHISLGMYEVFITYYIKMTSLTFIKNSTPDGALGWVLGVLHMSSDTP